VEVSESSSVSESPTELSPSLALETSGFSASESERAVLSPTSVVFWHLAFFSGLLSWHLRWSGYVFSCNAFARSTRYFSSSGTFDTFVIIAMSGCSEMLNE